MEYMVVYSSKTGNTKQVATEIFSALPGMSKDMQNIEEYNGKDADIFFVGFWANRGSCDMSVIDFISELEGKKIALFGTCGFGGDEEYYKTIEQKVSVWIPDDCEYLGAFMCQGKMPVSVRKRYESMLEQNPEDERMKAMVENFDRALSHPDASDLKNLRDVLSSL